MASVAFGASAQSANHYKPRDPPLGSRSTFNPATKHFEPVTSDKSYTYYRLAININETFYDFFDSDPKVPTLYTMVASGDVFDNTTAAKVGTFDMNGITTYLNADKTLSYMATMAVELGPNGDDTIFVKAALQRANLNVEIMDFDAAVVGGTGRYKGATGEVFFSGTQFTTPVNLYVAEFAVPKFKRF
ncbi:hypothetical protein OEZ86_005754 [Tetradesmus obliquus]|nr:hypothetical protein OEZ86_005754 [Tetradesmus obliquus]